jgi:hypothetical protein
MDEWRFDGSAGELIGMIKWVLLARQLDVDQIPKRFDILRDPFLVIQKAEKYGITSDAIAKEMIRIGIEARQICTLQLRNPEIQDCLQTLRDKGII